MPTRCTIPFPGRVTSRAKVAISPVEAATVAATGAASSRHPGSCVNRAASASMPTPADTWPTIDAMSWPSFRHDCGSRGSPGIG